MRIDDPRLRTYRDVVADLSEALRRSAWGDPHSMSASLLPNNETLIRAEMIEAGEEILVGELDGAVSTFWFARDLAKLVCLAMQARIPTSPYQVREQTRSRQATRLGTNEIR